jgi:hypothetical protein
MPSNPLNEVPASQHNSRHSQHSMASPMETDAEDAPTVPDAAVKAIYDQVQTQLKQHGWLLLPDDTLSRVSDGLVKFLLDQLSTSLSQSPISEAKALEAYSLLVPPCRLSSDEYAQSI